MQFFCGLVELLLLVVSSRLKEMGDTWRFCWSGVVRAETGFSHTFPMTTFKKSEFFLFLDLIPFRDIQPAIAFTRCVIARWSNMYLFS